VSDLLEAPRRSQVWAAVNSPIQLGDWGPHCILPGYAECGTSEVEEEEEEEEEEADRVKKNRPVTDLYKMEGTSHWPMIEDPEYIGDAIIARLDSI
jgi:hypothetical protein